MQRSPHIDNLRSGLKEKSIIEFKRAGPLPPIFSVIFLEFKLEESSFLLKYTHLESKDVPLMT